MLDKWSPSDIQTDKVFREMANHQLGPFLQVCLLWAITGGHSACVRLAWLGCGRARHYRTVVSNCHRP